jgi:hypothetical protein
MRTSPPPIEHFTTEETEMPDALRRGPDPDDAPALRAVTGTEAATEAEDSPVRPDRLTIWPTETGHYGIDVRWNGRECIMRAVVVRRLLAEAGYMATVGNSIDGRTWELSVRPVPADEVAKVISAYIW